MHLHFGDAYGREGVWGVGGDAICQTCNSAIKFRLPPRHTCISHLSDFLITRLLVMTVSRPRSEEEVQERDLILQ